MRYFTVHEKKKFHFRDLFSKSDAPEPVKLTDLDKAILVKCDTPQGADILSIINASRPYKDRFGAKEFASSDLVAREVNRLRSKGLLIGR